MSKNSIVIQEKIITKKLSNSEAAIGNQIRGIKDSTVAAYYLCDVKDFPKVKDYLTKDVVKVIVPSLKMKEYKDDVKSLLTPYLHFFKSKLSLYESSIPQFDNNQELSGLVFEERGTRIFFYLKDRDVNVIDQSFAKCIVGGVTNINFERIDDTIFTYLSVIDDVNSQILKEKTNITKEELANILDNYIDFYNPIDVGIRKFGIDFSDIFEKNIYSCEEVFELSKHKDEPTYMMRITEGISLAKVLPVRTKYENNYFNDEMNVIDSDDELIGTNKIFYGIPGCGKSYAISAMLSHKEGFIEEAKLNGIDTSASDIDIIRTTFYLDYSNSDFVGQIYPVVDDKGTVTYEHVPGPFTKALEKAYLNKDKMIYLVIEELNRGNAAAIFGDLFQLLDRVNETGNGKLKGESEYPISDTFIEGYFTVLNKKRSEEGLPLIDFKEGQIVIPNNLTIFATMNTSDQNVFPLDTAFKRRWKMKKIATDVSASKYADYYVPNKKGEKIEWCSFLDKINKFILEVDEEFNLEDKQIGPYFVTDDVLVKDETDIQNDDKVEEFNHKVFEYIWSDVAKFNREKWIQTPKYKKPNSYDALLDLINDYGITDTLKPFKSEGEN